MSKYNISLDSYKIFCTVAKHGSITKAAELLYLTQPTISMSIKTMEEKLGSRLFLRSQKGVTLTSEGMVLYSYLSKAMGLIHIAEQKHEELLLLDSGEVTICASDSIISGFLLPYLEKYNNLYSKITIKVINRTTDETIELLKTGTIDFGFINLPVMKTQNIDIVKSLPIQDCIVFGSKFQGLLNTDFNIKSLTDYPLLMLKAKSNTRSLLDKHIQQYGISLTPTMELDSTDLLIKFAKINLGIAFVIKEFVDPLIDNKNLFSIPLSPQIPNHEIGMIRLKDIPLSHAATAFLKLIV
jgi:DNA-binding transcriptional LysR family regulator